METGMLVRHDGLMNVILILSGTIIIQGESLSLVTKKHPKNKKTKQIKKKKTPPKKKKNQQRNKKETKKHGNKQTNDPPHTHTHKQTSK